MFSLKNLPFKKNIIKGTLILTLAGIASRFIGFFYRIFLTRAIGAEGIGLFQLVTPVMGIVFAICSSSIQTGISRFCAAKKSNPQWLIAGLLISLPLSIAASLLIYSNASFIAGRLLLNSDCTDLLKILALSFPFSSFHNCVNGYYFGRKQTGVPAFSQLIEQIIRVGAVYIYSLYCQSNSIPVTAVCALYGNFAGEIASSLFCGISITFSGKIKIQLHDTFVKTAEIFKFAMPLTANKLLMHLLQSGETILIPAQLILFGYTKTQATSVYGILNGMALPFILFPSAITNALSVMLLPEVSYAQSINNTASIEKTFKKCIDLCMGMGIISTMLFIFYGSKIGAIIFDEPLVYSFILILAWLCPFIYLSSTLGSIINGLGKTSTTCIHNIIAILSRIAFLIILVPKMGITGYLWGLLASQIFLCVAHYIKISRMLHISMNPYSSIIIPLFYSVLFTGISLIIYTVIKNFNIFPELVTLCLCGAVAALLFIFVYIIQINRRSQN